MGKHKAKAHKCAICGKLVRSSDRAWIIWRGHEQPVHVRCARNRRRVETAEETT